MNFLEIPKWKEKYTLSWCDHCATAIIVCPDCKNSSCNGGGCDKCHTDFEDFMKCKITVCAYLTDEEQEVYWKSLRIKHFVQESLAAGQTEINWKQLEEAGKLSRKDAGIFKEFLVAPDLK